MSAFEFFFSFYGLLLGLSVAVLATGAARAFKHRRTQRVGWLTPLLAVFVALDIATFWDAAWVNFRTLPFSYGLLVGGLVVAVVYFIAAALVFPDESDTPVPLDEHFWANKRSILYLLIVANLLGGGAQIAVNLTRDNAEALATAYGVSLSIYVILIGAAAWTKRRWLIAAAVGLHIALYLYIAVMSVASPPPPDTALGKATAEALP
ncbi:hypothetical protein ABAC460_16865 [Asticcacaulis sp. AC460]|uniref:hypothetical protein n=1 Tax=Asticcacaulis sp. AC460 TaxID=1282360 RepID=UPI0003C3F9B6|nr:hypothetical protein [Asticcacaulis sp. AC460]ESQ88331.1 hypothetical protein ABAC460_16865 [Asticcacaulis sp. AC460]